MNLLFLSIGLPDMASNAGGLYSDILHWLASKGINITAIAPDLGDGRYGLQTEGMVRVIRVKTGKFQGDMPFWKKGVNVYLLTGRYRRAVKKYLWKDSFDIVMMATPPATLVDVAELVKEHCGAKLYLILRDIHPECLDRKKVPQRFIERTDVYDECKRPYGVNPFVEWLLYRKSQKLYRLSDCIGCMSPGNMEYVKKIAPCVPDNHLTVLPNWYRGSSKKSADLLAIRSKYGLEGKFMAIFGGTIGEAQAVWNIAQLAKMNLEKKDVVFLVVGRGMKKSVLERIATEDHLTNMLFLNYMPREDYEAILQTADLGLISIDEKYTVPTCPSKIIGYMALAKPVMAMFNVGSDYGEYYIDKPGCGLYSVDLDYDKMQDNFEWFYNHPEERKVMGKRGYDYYMHYLTVEKVGGLLLEQLKSL